MDYCIRCNPVSLLVKDEHGELACRFHDKNYLLEHRDEPEAVAEFPPIELPQVAPEVEPTVMQDVQPEQPQ